MCKVGRWVNRKLVNAMWRRMLGGFGWKGYETAKSRDLYNCVRKLRMRKKNKCESRTSVRINW